MVGEHDLINVNPLELPLIKTTVESLIAVVSAANIETNSVDLNRNHVVHAATIIW